MLEIQTFQFLTCIIRTKDINCARRPHVNIYHFLFNSFRENFSRFSNGGDPGKAALLFPPLCWTISHPFQYIAQHLGCFEENQEYEMGE